MCSIDFDPCTLWEESPAVARKPHTCDGCGARIRPGEAYLRHANLHEGSWTRQAMCFACWWTRAVFAAEHGGALCTPGFLAEELRECLNGAPRGHLGPREWLWRSLLAGVLRRRHAARRGAP